jgi:Flp pilus assembly pilin Flp
MGTLTTAAVSGRFDLTRCRRSGRDQGVQTSMLMLTLYCKAKALFASRDRGATAAEYAMIVAAVVAAIAVAIFAFGDTIQGLFTKTCQDMVEGAGGTC